MIVANNINKSSTVACRSEANIIRAGGTHANKKVIVIWRYQLFPVYKAKNKAITFADNTYTKINIIKTGTAVSVFGVILPAKIKNIVDKLNKLVVRNNICFFILLTIP